MDNLPTDNAPAIDTHLLATLQCLQLPVRAKRCKPEFLGFYDKAYYFWRAMLVEGLLSEGLVNEAQQLKSDHFLRQEEMALLCKDHSPVGMIMFDWFRLSNPAYADYSYFQAFPKSTQEKLFSFDHETAIIMSQMMVHIDWRKNKIGPGISEILLGFAIKRFLESNAEVLITYTRNNRGTHQLCYRWGARLLYSGHQSHGVASDILVIYRDSVKQTDIPEIPELTDKLWEKREKGIINPLFI